MKTPIHCVIIDDDPYAIRILSDHIAEIPRLQIVKTYTKSIEALSELSVDKSHKLIFMDIDMPTLSGIQLAEQLKDLSNIIIFTTSYPEYALEAFKVRARHYLLKPFSLGDFAEVVNEVVVECFNPKIFISDNGTAFFLRTNSERGKLVKVLIKDIIYLQGSNNHVHIYTQENNYSIYFTLSEMEQKLKNNPGFYRVHKSYIINSVFLKKIVGNTIDLGKYAVLMSDQYKTAFMNYVSENTLVSKRFLNNKN